MLAGTILENAPEVCRMGHGTFSGRSAGWVKQPAQQCCGGRVGGTSLKRLLGQPRDLPRRLCKFIRATGRVSRLGHGTWFLLKTGLQDESWHLLWRAPAQEGFARCVRHLPKKGLQDRLCHLLRRASAQRGSAGCVMACPRRVCRISFAMCSGELLPKKGLQHAHGTCPRGFCQMLRPVKNIGVVGSSGRSIHGCRHIQRKG
jgi:hypothetical protein